jgi:hypothetical protein
VGDRTPQLHEGVEEIYHPAGGVLVPSPRRGDVLDPDVPEEELLDLLVFRSVEGSVVPSVSRSSEAGLDLETLC